MAFRENYTPIAWHVKEANERYDAERRSAEADAAEYFLVSGKDPDWTAEPPYGKGWDRTYNPQPYPEAEPFGDAYDGTGIGFLYGIDSSVDDRLRNLYAIELAGWELTRDGVEVRKTSTKVQSKELVPPNERKG